MKFKWDSDYMFKKGSSNTSVRKRVKRKLKAKSNRFLDKIYSNEITE
jgi:hypothetical protein